MIFNVLSILSVAGAAAAAALEARATVAVLYPRPGTYWAPGYAHNVTWIPQPGTGSISLINGGNTLPLTESVDLTVGRVEVNVPRVNPGSGYAIRIVSDGDTSDSGTFQIGTPDTPGQAPSVSVGSSTTVVILPSTSATANPSSVVSSVVSSAISSASSEVSSAISSVSESASSVASEISASASSALSSVTGGASSALSSVTSRASGALSTATSIVGSVTGSSTAPTSSNTGNSATGIHSMEGAKLGAILTTGVAIIATIAGVSLF